MRRPSSWRLATFMGRAPFAAFNARPGGAIRPARNPGTVPLVVGDIRRRPPMPPDRNHQKLKTSTTEPEPDYEGGARKYPRARHDGSDEFDQRAADNKRRLPYGLTEPLDETPEATAR